MSSGYKINKRPKDDLSDEETQNMTNTETNNSTEYYKESGNEILTLCVGQCGIFTGYEFLSTIMHEHGIDKDGKFIGDNKIVLNKIDTYFKNEDTKNNDDRYIPRFMFIDSDATSVNMMMTSTMKSIFDNNDNNMIHNGFNGPSITYSKGYYIFGLDIIDKIMDNIRINVEKCDYYQGINMLHSIGGGTGSGLSSLILEKLKNEYPKKYNFNSLCWPQIQGTSSYYYWSSNTKKFDEPHQHSANFSTYNMTFAIDKLIEYSDVCTVIHNPNLIWALKKKCHVEHLSFDDINYVYSQILSGITSSFRFKSEPNLCGNLRKCDHSLRPYPKLHFFNISHSPFFNKDKTHYNDHNISIISGCWENDVSNVKIEDGKLLATRTFYRSNDSKAISDITSFLNSIQSKNADDFVTWIPNNHSSSYINDGGFKCYKDKATIMATTIFNNTAIKSIFQRQSAMFAKQYRRRVWLHWYKSDGMEDTQFQEADKNIRDLITLYQDKQDAVVDLEDDSEDNDDDSDEEDTDYSSM